MTDPEAQRLARAHSLVPEMIERGKLVLAILDANPALTERLDLATTARVESLRKDTAEGRGSIYAYHLRQQIPGLHELLPPMVALPKGAK